MGDPYIIGAWLRVAGAALILIIVVLFMIALTIAFLSAARTRQRSLEAYVKAHRPLTPERRRELIDAWAAEQRRRDRA